MFKHLAGDKVDPHLICAAWNALCAYETLLMVQRGKLPKELDDMPEDANPYAASGMITEKDNESEGFTLNALPVLFEPDQCGNGWWIASTHDGKHHATGPSKAEAYLRLAGFVKRLCL
jgi:hypothetical protein